MSGSLLLVLQPLSGQDSLSLRFLPQSQPQLPQGCSCISPPILAQVFSQDRAPAQLRPGPLLATGLSSVSASTAGTLTEGWCWGTSSQGHMKALGIPLALSASCPLQCPWEWVSSDRNPLQPGASSVPDMVDTCWRGTTPGQRGIRRDGEAKPPTPGDLGAITDASAQRKLQVSCFDKVILAGAAGAGAQVGREGGGDSEGISLNCEPLKAVGPHSFIHSFIHPSTPQLYIEGFLSARHCVKC